MSKRISYDVYGGPEVLHFEDEQTAEPGPGQVRVRNQMIGVNPVDWKMVAGYFRHTDRAPFPHVPGWASTGIIEAVGDDVTDFTVGDAAIAGARGGAYRQRLVLDSCLVVPRPEGMSIEQAAALPSSAVAGYSMVQNLAITSEDTLLVHGAAGSVGAATVQTAIDRGATVIGTASPRNHDYLHSLGVIPVAYGDGLEDTLRDLGRITASADAVGGHASTAVTVAILGAGARAVTAWGDEHSQAAGIPWVQHPDDELEQTVAIATRGALTVRIGETFSLARAADALRLSQTSHSVGKILLAP